MYESVVFDVDGVLLRPHADHPGVYHSAVEEAFRAFDVTPPASDVEAFFGGSEKTLDGMRRVCERHGVDFEAFWPERERQSSKLQRRMMERSERELYDDCSVLSPLAETHDLGLVSNNQHATVEFMLDHFGLDDHFETAYGRTPTVEGYQRTKPDAYYLERALDDLGTRSALYVGDSASDVVAAHRAGLDSAFVWRDHRSGYELPAEPTHEIDRLTELTDRVAGP
mgnify:FL=1